MKFCPSCGRQYDDTTNFCSECGTKLIEGKQASSRFSMGDANAISGGVSVDSHDHTELNDNKHITNNNQVTNTSQVTNNNQVYNTTTNNTSSVINIRSANAKEISDILEGKFVDFTFYSNECCIVKDHHMELCRVGESHVCRVKLKKGKHKFSFISVEHPDHEAEDKALDIKEEDSFEVVFSDIPLKEAQRKEEEKAIEGAQETLLKKEEDRWKAVSTKLRSDFSAVLLFVVMIASLILAVMLEWKIPAGWLWRIIIIAITILVTAFIEISLLFDNDLSYSDDYKQKMPFDKKHIMDLNWNSKRRIDEWGEEIKDDYSTPIADLYRILSNEINTSLVQVMRMLYGVEMPDYYLGWKKGLNCFIQTDRKRVYLNSNYNGENWKAPSLGDSYYGYIKVLDNLRFNPDLQRFVMNDAAFLRSWIGICNERNPGEHGMLSSIDNLQKAHSYFMTIVDNYLSQLLAIKKEMRGK